MAEDARDWASWGDPCFTSGVGYIAIIRCCVCTLEGLTNSFKSTWGAKQGCTLSSLMFSLYVDPLEEKLPTEPCHR
jgi:hypothetical protein